MWVHIHEMPRSLISNVASRPLLFGRTWRTNDCGSLQLVHLRESRCHLTLWLAVFFSLPLISVSPSLNFNGNKHIAPAINESKHQNPRRNSRLWTNVHSKQSNDESLNCKWEQFLYATQISSFVPTISFFLNFTAHQTCSILKCNSKKTQMSS